MTGRKPNFPETETHHDSGNLAAPKRAVPFIESGVIHSLGHGSDDENNPLASVAPEPFGTQRSQVAVGPRTPCGPGVAQTADAAGDAGRLFIRGASKDTAQSWKLERRAPNSASLMALGRVFDEVGMMVAEEIGAGRFYGHEGRALKILRQHALDESPEGRFARDILREISIRNLT